MDELDLITTDHENICGERKGIIMSQLNQLNKEQQEAVCCTEGPLLILAGAGSGKTRVLTHRTAYLIEEMGAAPYHIMAITFTNKAAGEMRERIQNMVGSGSDSIWVSTFHSSCVRILRRYIDRLGYANNFTIYDAEDQKMLMKDICKRLQIDTKIHKEKTFLNVISSAKDELIGPAEFETRAAGDYNMRRQAEVYREYQRCLKQNNALDFDDLIFRAVELFRLDKEVLEYYQNRFRYIMVDEYQDTNTAQFEFIRLLAGKYQNLCVVGDDDQSIYKFRGANIYNILNFEKHFPDARVIKLEQNYRSTQNILNAANNVISNNVGRKQKRLWTENGKGDRIRFEQLESGYEEADAIARDIGGKVRKGEYRYRDCAVLYRTNAQSRLFEECFITSNIPYKIVGGVNFYSRKEIKDLLCYLKTIDNGRDDIAVRRVINVPKRGIGAASINKVMGYALDNGMDFYSALCSVEEVPGIGRAAEKIRNFVLFIQSMKAKAKIMSVANLIREVIEATGYVKELEAEGTDEAEGRIQNIDELISKAAAYEESADEPSLQGFLEEVALVADIDSLDADSDYVVLMTLHSAKGLEFPNVYLAGMEDGLFPSYLSITEGEWTEDGVNTALEEERRLAYVGITRAKEHLMITAALMRMIRGENRMNAVSRFVEEIPSELLEDGSLEHGRRNRNMDIHTESSYQKAKREFRNVSTRYGSSRPQSYYAAAMEESGIFDDRNQASFSGRQKAVVYTPVSGQRNFASSNTMHAALDYGVGDRVRHMKFGDGEVTAVVEGGRDFEVTVDFDKAGTKKMFASFAKLKKI